MDQSLVHSVSQHITRDAVKSTLMEMVNISSPTGYEGELAKYIVTRMRDAGLTAWLQDVTPGRPNAVGALRGDGTGKNLLFTGHMDVSYDGDEDYLVGDGYKPKAVYRDGWIWGLGASNMKSGLAASLVAIEAVAKARVPLHGDVMLGAVVGETEKAPVDEFEGARISGYGIGSRYLITHGETVDYCVLTEPTRLRVCTANMGVLWFKITIAGTVSHAAMSNDPSVVNAVEVMNELLPRIKTWAKDYEARQEYFGEHPNVTIAAIRGGLPWRLARNPHECSLYIDIRTLPGVRGDDIKRELRAVLRTFASEKKIAEPTMFQYVNDPPTTIDHGHPLVSQISAAHKAVHGKDSPYVIRRTGADATHFNRYDIPCVCYGPGAIPHPDYSDHLMHSTGEHASVENLFLAANVYSRLILNVCASPDGELSPG
jgi:acetylornithine deacetylase/succinyl-diaminopimelate desuccinylase-like protein